MQLDTFTAQFSRMEIDEELFSMRAPDGTPSWDIVRLDVREALYEYLERAEGSAAHTPDTAPVPSSARILRGTRKIGSMGTQWVRLKRIQKAEMIAYTCSRYRDANGLPADFAAEDALHVIEDMGKVLQVESTYNLPNVLNARYLGSLTERMFPLSAAYKRYLTEASQRIADAQRKHFGVSDTQILHIICRSHLDHRTQYRIWAEILDRSGARIVLLTQNGSQKGLFRAAQQRGVKVIECQHGLIHPMHPAYAYPLRHEIEQSIFTPDVLLLFAEHWARQCRLPRTELLVTGNNRFASPGVPSTRTGPVVFVTATPFQRFLSPLAMELAEAMPSRSFVMKLHPSFLSERPSIEHDYRALPNLTVIGVEKSIAELMATASDMVIVESTAGYEALDRQVPVHILKAAGYHCHQDIFSNPNVHLFSTAQELQGAIFKPVRDHYGGGCFFARFEPQKVRALVHSILIG